MQVFVVGSSGNDLEGLLQAPGRVVRTLSEARLRGHRGAKGDLYIIDARGAAHLPVWVATLTHDNPDAGYVLVCSKLDPVLMLEGMRAGIRECVPEPIDQAELNGAISRVADEEAVEGSVFAFVGAKGGVGTTTTAVNVAVELAKVAPKQTLVIDLHLSNGDAAIFLGAEPRFSVADALANVHRLDQAFFRGLVVQAKGQVDLLASPDGGSARGDAATIRALVEFASRHYRYTVLDVPRSEPAALDGLDPAKKIVVVANQELATVRNANRMVAGFRGRYGKERVALAIARFDANAGIGQSDIEKAVGMKVRHVLPSDYRRAVEALNSGVPLSQGNHTSLSAALRDVARDLAGLPREEDAPRPSGGLLGLFGRRN